MQKFIPVIARILLAQIFLVATAFQLIAITSHPDGYTAYQVMLGQYGLPGIFAPLTLLIQLAGGVLVLIGFKTRAAAYLLAGYSVFVAFVLKLNEPIVFLQYLAIAGGFLALGSQAPTALSVDNLKKQ